MNNESELLCVSIKDEKPKYCYTHKTTKCFKPKLGIQLGKNTFLLFGDE